MPPLDGSGSLSARSRVQPLHPKRTCLTKKICLYIIINPRKPLHISNPEPGCKRLFQLINISSCAFSESTL